MLLYHIVGKGIYHRTVGSQILYLLQVFHQGGYVRGLLSFPYGFGLAIVKVTCVFQNANENRMVLHLIMGEERCVGCSDEAFRNLCGGNGHICIDIEKFIYHMGYAAPGRGIGYEGTVIITGKNYLITVGKGELPFKL